MVSTPATAHATRSQPALPIWRAISAGTIKMPEPIMAPTTIMVESNKFNPRAKLRGACSVVSDPPDTILWGMFIKFDDCILYP